MDQLLEQITTSLNQLADAIIAASGENRTLNEMWGWNQLALNRTDIAFIPRQLAKQLENADIQTIDDPSREMLSNIPAKLGSLRNQTLPQLFGSNGSSAGPILISTLSGIKSILDSLFGWQVLQDSKAMPAPLANRLRSIQSQVNAIVPDKDALLNQIKLINEATEAAESLPTDLESLNEARARVTKISTDSAEIYGKIGSYLQTAGKDVQSIEARKLEADKLVEKCEEAYKITTTKGLAAAFDERARRLSVSMWWWVFILFVVLAVGVVIGYKRIDLLSNALKEADPAWGIIWMHIALSIVSVSAPIWIAWLATKQISKRFQLSEDYAFKASVAKAYEGYRKEAARLDEAFEARLFSSALSRLEESPLRLVDYESYGSPWHELIASPGFQKAMSAIPEFKNAFIEIFKNGNGNKAAEIGKIVEAETPGNGINKT